MIKKNYWANPGKFGDYGNFALWAFPNPKEVNEKWSRDSDDVQGQAGGVRVCLEWEPHYTSCAFIWHPKRYTLWVWVNQLRPQSWCKSLDSPPNSKPWNWMTFILVCYYPETWQRQTKIISGGRLCISLKLCLQPAFQIQYLVHNQRWQHKLKLACAGVCKCTHTHTLTHTR